MQLAAWLKESCVTPSELASRIGRDVSTITRLIPTEGKKQTRRPSLDLIAQITTATGGAVTANDWMDGLGDEVDATSGKAA